MDPQAETGLTWAVWRPPAILCADWTQVRSAHAHSPPPPPAERAAVSGQTGLRSAPRMHTRGPRLEGPQSADGLDSGPLRACPLRGGGVPSWKGLSQRADWTQVCSAHAHSGAPARRVSVSGRTGLRCAPRMPTRGPQLEG